jgi:transketolase
MSEMLYQRDIYGKTLVELGRQNKDIIVLDADLSGSTRTGIFAKEFPERFFNFGVAEQNMMATASGLASCGKTVFVSTFAIFATGRAWDQVRNSITYNNFLKLAGLWGLIGIQDLPIDSETVKSTFTAFFKSAL